MGTIISRKRNDGTTVYSAQILLKRKGIILHREAKTFDRRQAAKTWLNLREAALAQPGAIERVKALDPTLAKAIGRYTTESRKAIGRTKTQCLKSIGEMPIGALPCSKIGSAEILEMLGALRVLPQTAGNYLSHLRAVFVVARPAWGYQLDMQAMEDATVVARKLGLVGRSAERTRRPTIEEMDQLMERFERIHRHRPSTNPMGKVVLFAMFSSRRLEEICRITWPDLDEKRSRIMVRDMKDPGDKHGNDVRCVLPPEALAIILSMPRVKGEDRIFPYSPGSIGASFTRAHQFLGIDDLVLHDLRHEGISRLFEMGGTIPEVAAVSGHRGWASLKRYTHLDQSGDKWADWPWKGRILGPVAG